MFNTIFVEPLYNLLVLIIGLVPGYDVGLAIIILTILVRLVLVPLQQKMIRTQAAMRVVEPLIKEIRAKYKDNSVEQAQRIMAVYRNYRVNPFASIILMVIQIPILLGLYFVFIDLSSHPEWLYSFVTKPTVINDLWIGLVDLTKPNWLLAVIAAISQYIQISLAMPKIKPNVANPNDFAQTMNKQMRYMMPGMIFVISLGVPSAVTLYWVTSNLFMIGHELFFRSRHQNFIPATTNPTKTNPALANKN